MVDFSLDVTIDEDGETTFLERLEEPGPGPQDTFIGKEQDEEVQAALAKVKKRIGELGWDIVQERLTQDKPRTLEELGQRWGVSRERVRQVELKTKHFLARYLSAFNQDQEPDVTADAA
jgi:RNA polymerase primary sigma factor